MEDSISTNQPSKTKRNLILFVIATVFLIAAMFYSCIKSLPKITVSKETPITFYTSGSNEIIFFEVIGDGGKLWKLYPKDRVTLKELSIVKYGEIPSSCKQAFPEDLSSLSPLVEGGRYHAFVLIFDGPPVRVEFTIKDGKTVDVLYGR